MSSSLHHDAQDTALARGLASDIAWVALPASETYRHSFWPGKLGAGAAPAAACTGLAFLLRSDGSFVFLHEHMVTKADLLLFCSSKVKQANH